MNTESSTPTPALLQTYQARLLTPVLMLRDELVRMMRACGAVGDDLLACITDLAGRDRGALSSVYDAIRESQCFQSLILAPPLIEAAQAFVGSPHLHVPFRHSVFRMDLPSESFRAFAWHQDFPYNMLSRRAATAWIPIVRADSANGSVDYCVTASDRLYPVRIAWKRGANGERLGGRDAFIVERYGPEFDAAAEKLKLDVGDFVLFAPKLVHRSGHNPGPSVRISVQVRFGDLFDPEVVERRWANRRADGFETFKRLHPELVEWEEAE